MRVLAPVKQNLAAPQPSLAYTVTAENAETPWISWQGPTELTADQLLGDPPMSQAETHLAAQCQTTIILTAARCNRSCRMPSWYNVH